MASGSHDNLCNTRTICFIHGFTRVRSSSVHFEILLTWTIRIILHNNGNILAHSLSMRCIRNMTITLGELKIIQLDCQPKCITKKPQWETNEGDSVQEYNVAQRPVTVIKLQSFSKVAHSCPTVYHKYLITSILVTSVLIPCDGSQLWRSVLVELPPLYHSERFLHENPITLKIK